MSEKESKKLRQKIKQLFPDRNMAAAMLREAKKELKHAKRTP